MAELHWFPLYFEDWLTSRSITAMLPEQEGAYLRLLIHAWGDGSHEPWLEANDAKLAAWSRLGARWRKLGPAIAAEFEHRNGMLFNVRLSEIWKEQQEKHATAVVKAKKAVATRESNKKKRQTNVDATREYPGDHLQDGPVDDLGDHPQDGPEVKQPELDVVVEPASYEAGVLPSTAPVGALALNAQRATGADVRTGKLSLVGDVQVPRGSAGIPGDAPTTRAELDARGRALDKAYAERMTRAVEDWKLLHSDEFAQHERAELAAWSVASRTSLRDSQKAPFEAALVERVRKALSWPNQEKWVEEKQRRGELAEILVEGAA